ncbi:protein TRM32-like isoform X2 [Glycine soja]|nr:protein TRM32-like isoform X2 [Glycine soja]RZB62938.1 Protein TRM32 isoform B [Glycine soja]
MWGMLQILDYHRWRVKKVFPHKRRRHATYKRKPILYNQHEDQQHGVTEAEPLLVGQPSKKLHAAGKSSPKNRKKEPRTEKEFNNENSKGNSSMDYSKKNQASREYALHLEKDGKTTEAALNHKPMETNKHNRDISNKFEKHTDVFELLRVEKDLLLKFLRDIDFGGKKVQQASHINARLKKSGSFPLASTSQMRNISSRSLKHKQNEIWAFPKGEKLHAGTQESNMLVSSSVKDTSYEKSMPLASDLGVDSAMKQKAIISSGPSQGSNHKGWNQVVLHQFKVIKQKIKYVLVEFRKSGYQTTSAEAIHRRASPEYSIIKNEEEISQSLEDGVVQQFKRSKSSNETRASDYDSNKHDARLMRRTSSLNESLDRYTQLFEKSFSKDTKWQSSKSKSLKLTNEDKNHKNGHAPRFSRSNLSMPNLETLSFILQDALFDTNDIGTTVEAYNRVHRKSVSLPLKIDKSLDHFKEAEIVETVEGSNRDVNPSLLSDMIMEKIEEIDEEVTCDQKEEMHEPAVGDGSFPQEKEEMNNMTTNLSKEVMATLGTSFEDNKTGNAEGTELNSLGSTLDELETDLSYKGNVYHSLPDSSSDRNASVTAEDTDNTSNFKYVKNVLEFSGFLGNEHTQKRYTVDQPLKPSIFQDLDATLCHEIEPSEETISHQLLFNLVNEVLLEIYGRSPTYFPRPFSFNPRFHPMPKGNYLLDEVWNSVNSYLTLRPELDQTLEDVIGRDLAKGKGWMILQEEEEYVALELEEMIMDDLLDEFIFS